MSLREDLAKRMYIAAFCSVDHPEVADKCADFALSVSHNKSHYGRIADECIRQMEWARRQGHGEVDYGPPQTRYEMGGGTSIYCTRETFEHPLTLAPNDWKPE